MAVTGTYAEVIHLTLPETVEVDSEHEVQEGELGRAFAAIFVEMPRDEQLDVDIADNVF